MKFEVSRSPQIQAAQHLASLLETSLAEHDHVLLLLAGGSAADVYNELPTYIDEHLDYTKLMVMMGDERWDTDPEHEHSDWVQFRNTSFYHFLRERGARLVDILGGKSHQEEADAFNALLEEALASGYFVISMLGIGTDGHTAGILPAENPAFADTFFVDELAVAHELDTIHPRRITITPAMIKQADAVFCYVRGEKKARIISDLAKLDASYPEEAWETMIPVHPALILSAVDATVFTDQNP
ncbi:MAG: Glucosamine-6-phosphate deaminase [candidate division WS6 bacterium OLB20]|uniref:Glucosamine-6-phosphate deaminase n=1 Tax=candidate division WS6 bacterium OLB20 TaxID=1617426 RepID=A0A136LVP2_9BACT|nr:MAG: Glucosamine-6-phosphate deaminase [candidate division WS6 bacterium OLB20]